MNDRLNIPQKLKIGFQKRSDTYSGLLAYVTYITPKGEIAKEKSWSGWKSDKVDVMDCDNVPTTGFVLNRHAGGYKSGWNFRQSYIRVWDPRGFEIEIKVDNLLFILDNCTSVKGRGLDGEFVYAWDGLDLVLLPVDTEDYRESMKTINRTVEISVSDLKIGTMYETKDGHNVVYLGKLPLLHSNRTWVWGEKSHYDTVIRDRKEHVFVSSDDFDDETVPVRYYRAANASKLISVVSENELSPEECKDIEERLMAGVWPGATEYKTGKFRLVPPAGMERWNDDVEDGIPMIGVYHDEQRKMTCVFEYRFATEGPMYKKDLPKYKVVRVERADVYTQSDLRDNMFVEKSSYASGNALKYVMQDVFKGNDNKFDNIKDFDVYAYRKTDSEYVQYVENQYGCRLQLGVYLMNIKINTL